MKTPPSNYRPALHVFVCTNRREVDAPLPCCARAGGAEVLEHIRAGVRARGLASKIWVTESKCLSFCSPTGVTVVAWPAGRWFHEVKIEDVDALLESLKG